MPNRLVSSRCPECGAPVDFQSVPRHQLQVRCQYCGTFIAIPGRIQPHSTSDESAATSSPTIVVSSDGSVVKGGWGCSAIGWLLLILIISGMGIWSSRFMASATQLVNQVSNQVTSHEATSDSPRTQPLALPPIEQVFAPKPRLTSRSLRLAGNESAPVQMVIAAYREDGTELLGFDPEQRTEVWRSPLFSERYYEMGLAADAAHVYVADGAKLVALARATGQISWQSSLANNLQTNCVESTPCLQKVGDQVVTLARDGTVQGFAGETGAPLWSRRLNSQLRQLLVSDDRVILVDTDSSNRALVLALNGVNGDLLYELRPTCTFPYLEMRPHASDQFLITPDGSALLVVGSGTYACVWRYNLADGALVWSYTSPDAHSPLPFAWSMSSLAAADPFIYFVKEEDDVAQIYALDTQSQGAAPLPLYGIKDYTLTLLYALGDLLLVSAQPDFARDEVELWAINRSTGERRWQRKLETTHTFDKWITRPTDQGIFLAVCSWENDECRFEVLDIATGTSPGQVREVTKGRLDGAMWIGNLGYLTIDSKLYAINLTSAAIEYIWP